MEFNPRDFQPGSSRGSLGVDINAVQKSPKKDPENRAPRKKLSHRIKENKILAILSVALLGGCAVLILALIFGISFAKNETGAVDKDKYQVIALADDQAYFGKISAINNKYVIITNVFYLNKQDTNETSTAATQLIKRGCEIHSPTDTMVITRDRVNFWENLNTDGQVAKLITQWYEQNPDGQKCNTTNPTQQTTTDSTLNNMTTPDTTTDSTNTTDQTGTTGDTTAP